MTLTSTARPEQVAGYAPVVTEWLRDIAETVHGRGGERGRGLVGARVYMTEEMNQRAGFEQL